MPDELGYQINSLATWASLAADSHETNSELIWPQSINVQDRMRREDAQVGSVLRAVTFPIRKTGWAIDGTGCSAEVAQLVAQDLGLALKGQAFTAPTRTKGRFSWTEHVRLALLELVFGHSVFEQVYRIEGARAHLAKLAWRPPRTIDSFQVEPDGGLKSITQHGHAGASKIVLPVDRLVVYVNEREGANWTGQSLLRTAYKNWLLKDRMLRAQALVIERNGLGIPVYTAPPAPEGASTQEVEAWNKTQVDAGLKIAKQMRAGDDAGASLPNGATLNLLAPQGDLPDAEKPIRYHDEQIARAVLAHFLNLGTETGSWALGSTFANFFTDSLNAVAEHIREVTQQHVIEDLVDANWGPNEPAPRLVFDQIGAEQPATAEAMKMLVEARILTADPSLEAYARERFGLPALEVAADGTIRPDVVRALGELVQKLYLGTPEKAVISTEEARALLKAGGYPLDGSLPAIDPPQGDA